MIVLFEDERVATLSPVALTRPAYSISCGGQTLLQLAGTLGVGLHCRTRSHLMHDGRQNSTADKVSPEFTLFLNASVAPDCRWLDGIREFLTRQEPFLVNQGNRVAAAGVLPSHLANMPDSGRYMSDWLLNLDLPLNPFSIELLEYPHDIIRCHLKNFQANLRFRIERNEYQRQGEQEVYLGQDVRIAPNVYIDASAGPVVVESGTQIGPFAYLQGPCLVGAGGRVIDHASVKEFTCTGHTVKIGGEVEGSIIEPYTNKQHHGFLGHSYLGSWVNLGAGTSNSDLKNTYGKVNMEYDRQPVRTGMQFMGCIVGDYSKTAVNTSIFTGKVIGVCSYVYGFVSTNVPSFCNYARSFGQITEIPPSVAITTQERMFQRRGILQRPEDIELIESVYQLTHHERRISDEQISL